MPRNNFNKAKKISMTHMPDDPYIHIDEARVVASSGKQNGVMISKDCGTTISGDLSIKAKPENVIIGQIYKFNNMMMSLLPSTIYTPIPTLKQGYTDKVDSFKEIANNVKEAKSLLGALENV